MRTALVALLLASTALPALAEDPCAADVQQRCNKAVGVNAVLGCLRDQQAQLTPACQANLAELTEIAKEYGDDCQADARQYCAEVAPGGGRIVRCLVDNMSFVSQSCQSAINRVRMLRSQIMGACAGEVGTFCQMVPEGAGRILACLRKNQDKLGGTCKDVLKTVP